MAVGIAARVATPRNDLGGSNPLDMVKTMFELRNMQTEFQSKLEAGQILATSNGDWDLALNRLSQSPNAAWNIPVINQIREGLRTQADIARLHALTTGQNLANDTNKLKFGILTSTDAADADRIFKEMAPKLTDPSLADSVRQSLYHDNPTPAQLEQRRIAQLMGLGGESPEQAFTGRGYQPPGTIMAPGPMGGIEQPTRIGGVPGVGSTPGAATVPRVGAGVSAPASAPQLEQWKDLTKHQDELNNQVQAGTGMVATVDEARHLLNSFTPGKGTSWRIEAAAWAQSLDADDSTINLISGGSDAAAVQEFNKLMYTQVMNQLDQALPAGSRLNLKEWETFMKANPTSDMQRKAIERIFDNWQRAFARNRIEQRFLSAYVDRNAQNPAAAAKWQSYWNDIQQRKKLLDRVWYNKDGKTIDPSHVIKLLGNDDPQSRAAFDDPRVYGPGSATRFLDEGG